MLVCSYTVMTLSLHTLLSTGYTKDEGIGDESSHLQLAVTVG